MKILFITANRLGDAVLTTGLLALMERTCQNAHITIACGPYGADLFRAIPCLDRLIIIKKRRYNLHWLDLWRECHNIKWDLVVDMRNSLVSRLLMTNQLAVHKKIEGVHKVIENAAVLGMTPAPDPFICIAPDAEKRADEILQGAGRFIAFGPAANWAAKQWPIENFRELANQLLGSGGMFDGAKLLVLCDAHEKAQIDPLIAAMPKDKCIAVVGQSLQTAAACLKRAELYVGNDSGLMHLAAALDVPTLGLFGPGFPEIYGPWGKKAAYVCTDETRDELMAILENTGDAKNLMRSLTVQRALAGVRGLF